MRDRLIYILKHNKLIQKLYVVIMSFVFKVWGEFLITDDKLVLFVSFAKFCLSVIYLVVRKCWFMLLLPIYVLVCLCYFL